LWRLRLPFAEASVLAWVRDGSSQERWVTSYNKLELRLLERRGRLVEREKGSLGPRQKSERKGKGKKRERKKEKKKKEKKVTKDIRLETTLDRLLVRMSTRS
jgi:hypothetical protein